MVEDYLLWLSLGWYYYNKHGKDWYHRMTLSFDEYFDRNHQHSGIYLSPLWKDIINHPVFARIRVLRSA